MEERADFYWQSIAKQFDFDARQQLAQAVEAFSLESGESLLPAVAFIVGPLLRVVAPRSLEAPAKGAFSTTYDSSGRDQGRPPKLPYRLRRRDLSK